MKKIYSSKDMLHWMFHIFLKSMVFGVLPFLFFLSFFISNKVMKAIVIILFCSAIVFDLSIITKYLILPNIYTRKVNERFQLSQLSRYPENDFCQIIGNQILICSTGLSIIHNITRVSLEKPFLKDLFLTYTNKRIVDENKQIVFVVITDKDDSIIPAKNYILLSRDLDKAQEEYKKLSLSLKSINPGIVIDGWGLLSNV